MTAVLASMAECVSRMMTSCWSTAATAVLGTAAKPVMVTIQLNCLKHKLGLVEML